MDWVAIGGAATVVVPIVATFSVLVGVIWRGQNQRLDRLEGQAQEDRRQFSDMAEKIFDRIDALAGAMGAFQVKVAETFATKVEVRQHQENGHTT